MSRPFDLEVLKSFVAIADCGTFTAAAAQLHRTPAALSMQIKSLETRLGHTLFVRGPRAVRLTAHGETLLSHARRLLALDGEIRASLSDERTPTTLRLGLPDDLGHHILPAALADLARDYPDVQVDVVATSSTALRQRFDADDLDMAMVTAEHHRTRETGETLIAREIMTWAGLPRGTAQRRRPLPVALAARGCPWRATAIAALDDAGLAYRLAYASETGLGQHAAAAADLAVAALPRRLVAPPLAALTDLPSLPDTYVALRQRTSPTPAAARLARALSEVFAARS